MAISSTLPPAATGSCASPGPAWGWAPAPAFFDLDRHGWARAAINAVAARGIIKGSGPGTFDPDGRVTRAQLAALLQRLSTFRARLGAGMERSLFVKPDGTVWAWGDGTHEVRSTPVRV